MLLLVGIRATPQRGPRPPGRRARRPDPAWRRRRQHGGLLQMDVRDGRQQGMAPGRPNFQVRSSFLPASFITMRHHRISVASFDA